MIRRMLLSKKKKLFLCLGSPFVIDNKCKACYIVNMKKKLEKAACIISACLIAAALLLMAAWMIKPLGDVVFSVLFGSWYSCKGQAVLTLKERKVLLPVYKAHGKPFLIVGPYDFGDYKDFFFVNKKQLVITAVDKGGDVWCRGGNLLFMLDDLNHWDALRMPWSDCLHTAGAKNEYDKAKEQRNFTFAITEKGEKLFLSLPEKFFTADMENAFNVTTAQ